jgi:LPXTG-site transpeptidase (sortase) family protein
MRDNHEIHKYYDSNDPHMETLTITKAKDQSRGLQKNILRILVVVAVFAVEGLLMWTMADSKIAYSPIKSEVIAGVKPPKPKAVVAQDKAAEKPPALALADMYLVIPKLFINAPIDPVGTNEKGEMASPPSLDRVTWYKEGTKPGLQGSAVLAGHYGGPQQTGIFRTIDRLKAGDIIEVRTKSGAITKFGVYKSATYTVSEVPLQDLFNKDDGNYLNLVTCVGTWDPNNSSYDKRMIVYAKKL